MPVINEEVRFDIKVELENAIVQMKKIADSSESGAGAVKSLSMFLAKMSKETKVPLEQLRKTLEGINNEIAKKRGAGIFGDYTIGDKGIFNAVKGYNEASIASGRFAATQSGVVTSINKSSKAMEEADRRARGFGHGIDVVRTALGTLLAVGIFQALGAIQSFLSGAIEQAKQFEATLYRLANAERQLSLDGVEVSVKGLEEGIEDLKRAFPIFSKEDIAELIGGIATTTKELGLSEDQMLKLGAAVAILNVNSTEAETLLQTMGKVVNSVISPQSKSVGNLGLSFGKAKLEAKAFEMQILQVGETFADLTEKEKTEIKYQIVLETAGVEGVESLEELRDLIKESGGDFEALNAYLESNAAKLEANSAAWKDLQTTVGQVILPFIPTLTEFFRIINDGFQLGKVIIIEVTTLLGALVTAYSGAVAGLGSFTDIFKSSLAQLRESLVNQFFKEIPEDAPEWFMRGWGKHIKEQAETATGPVQDLAEAVEEFDAAGLKQKIEDIIEDTQRAREDLAENLTRKLEDLDGEYQRKAIDAEMDYRRKIEDINRDAERDIAKIKDKHREEDKRDEEKYQLQLWELRMRFLMDLEDALHARDARQVIRLQKQYSIDKEALRRKHELEGKQREEDQSNELEDIERRRQERLADAKIELEQKLADQRIAKQRELEDLNVWYAREQADLEEAQQRKLETLLRGWVEEQKITESNAAQVYAILAKYFGPGGLTDALYQYMMQSLIASTQGAINAAGSLPSPVANLVNQGVPTTVANYVGGMAKGGTLLATRPTRVTFGEAGPEIAQFTPLSKIGSGLGQSGQAGSFAGGGMNGNIVVDVSLSPDLRASVVEEAMDGVGEVIFRVNGTKI